jgi:dynein heavy chain
MQTDFGLRNVLTMLRMLSVEKRNSTSLEAELVLVGRVLCHVNQSKVAHQDEGLFLSMVNEVFPGVSLIQTFDDVDVEQAVFRAVDSFKLVNYSQWTRKVMQVS